MRKDYFELGGGDSERPVSAPAQKVLTLNRVDGLIEPGVVGIRYRLPHLQFLRFVRCVHLAVQQVRKTHSNASLQNYKTRFHPI